MDKAVASSSHDLAQRLYDKNIELENRRRKSAQARVPSDPNAWQQMRENFETIILEDYTFSEKHSIEFALWQLHYRRIEEFRAHYNAASASVSTTPQTRGGPARPDRASKIRIQFKTFLSEATGFYHDLILKIRAKYGLPIGQFYPDQENHNVKQKDEKKSVEIKKGLISCHRCLIYLGDLARYKGLYGEGESKSRDYAAASSYYLQAASLWPSSGNPHHQLAILATYSGDELMAVYRYFRSLAVEHPFSTARDNLIVAFEKNRQSHTQLHSDSNGPVQESPNRAKGRGKEKEDTISRSKELITDTDVDKGTAARQMFKAFRVRFVRLNGILFTHTSLETFEEILSLVINGLQELLSSGPEEELSFGADADENGLFMVILVSILIFTVNNVKGGSEGQSYADIVQNTVLLKNALITFFEVTGQLLKRCIQLADPFSSFMLPSILVCVEWIACHSDVAISNETDEKRITAQSKFWSSCVSLFNKLLSAGLVSYDDDEDMSCFTDMTRYEEGGSEYQPALWEDFELRGFLPLEPAHAFLDFSRKHSDSKKDKLARMKRILSAGKVIADKITIDHKKVRFDSKLNMFVIGVETQKDAISSKSYGGIKKASSDTGATVMVKQLKVESHVEGEEDDEVIVFRPNLSDNRAETIFSKWSQQEGFQNVQNKDVGSLQYAASQVSMLPVDSYNHSIGQAAQSVNSTYTQSIGQSDNNSYTSQSTGQSGQPVNDSYTSQSIRQVGQPDNNSYTQSIGQAGQAVNNCYASQTIVQGGQPSNNNYTSQSLGQTGQPVNNSYTSQSIGQAGQPIDNSHTQSIRQVGQPVNNSYAQSIGQAGQPVNNIYVQSIGQAGQPVNNSFTRSIGQPGQALKNIYTQSIGQPYQFQSPMWSGNRQAVGSVASGLQGLSLLENGHLGQPEMHRDVKIPNTSLTVPSSSIKVSTNRPIRHLGPPPGFSLVRPKQVNEPGQNPLNDDYSWLDGYQLNKGGGQPQPSFGSQYTSGSVATSSFPFPGKQVTTVRFEGEQQKNLEPTHSELLQPQQYVSQMDQQGQPVWKSNHFV